MTIQVSISEPLAGKVADAAKSQGKSPEDFVLAAIATQVDPLGRFDEVMAPVRQHLSEIGETEDDATDYFETVKHELRRQRRAAT
jgi:hypothetical protein